MKIFNEPIEIDEEPWVLLPNNFDIDNSKFLASNQKRRQKIKFKFFINSFDFLHDSEIEGSYFEFGIHRARTFRMALSCAKYYQFTKMNFHAFDSFEGLPNYGENLKSTNLAPGNLKTNLKTFKKIIDDHNLFKDKIFCHKGFYEENLSKPSLTRKLEGEKAAFITIDCDLKKSADYVFNFIENYIQHGTVLYIDDFFVGWNIGPGCKDSFENFSKISRFKFVEHMTVGWWGKSFIASES